LERDFLGGHPASLPPPPTADRSAPRRDRRVESTGVVYEAGGSEVLRG
jgi:hypothetical protein